MDYSKRIWKPNDIISTSALNHMETGIEEANIEIEDSKIKKDGTSFPLLKDRLNDIDTQLGKLDNLDTQLNRLENIDSQLNKLESIDLSKFENIDQQFDRLDNVDSRFESVENRIEELEQSDQFVLEDKSIEVGHLSEGVIELINQNSFTLENKSVDVDHLSDGVVELINQNSFTLENKSIEVEHLSENVIDLINQNSFVLEDKSIGIKHLSEEIVNLLNKDCSISEEDYNVSFDVNEIVFGSKPLYTVTYDATENCYAHFTVVCDMSRIANYKTINLNMKISNWSGPARQQLTGGGVFSSNVFDLDGSYVHTCSYQGTPVINGDIVNGEGTLTGSIVPIMSADALSKPYAKLAFVFTSLKVGEPVSFDINEISLTMDGQPLEMINFGGFFPREGCIVTSHIEEPDEPGDELEEHVIAKYAFNSVTDNNLLPTFGGVKNYTIKDEAPKNIFDGEWSPGALNDADGKEMVADSAYPNTSRSSYFEVEPNTLYYFNKELHVFWYDSNKVFISCKLWSSNNAVYQATSPEGAAYARVYRGSVATDLIISKQTMNTINRTIMSSDDFTSCKFQSKAALLSVEYLNVTNKATVLNHLFATCSNLTSVNASGWDTSNVTAMNDMFCQCSSLISIEGLDTWDTGNVTNMQGMFSKCSKIETLNLSSFDTKNLTNVNYLFENCFLIKDLNISTWDVSKINEFTWTFYNCSLLTELDLSGWNMKDSASTSLTLQGCQSLIKVICKQHTLLKIQGVIPTRRANSWGTIICEDLDSTYDISVLQSKYWNVEGPSVEPDEPEVPDEPNESAASYHVEYTPTETLNSNNAAHFTIVMNRSDYIIGSTIHFNMNISNWNGPERTAMEVGGGIFVANSSALDGSFNGGSAIEHLLLNGNLVDGNGVLERTFTAPNITQDGSFVKLAFSFTKVELGQSISFDVTNMSLTVNDNPVEILNFGGFFSKEGCIVTEIE